MILRSTESLKNKKNTHGKHDKNTAEGSMHALCMCSRLCLCVGVCMHV